ncbi:MAG: ferritin family protein [Candidatus Omnitrophota bacterium]|jgi:rubrerythrin
MLSKEDYLEYLKEMIDVERKMMRVYCDLEGKTNDSQIKAIFSKLMKDETSHANAVDALVGLIKQKYPQKDNE